MSAGAAPASSVMRGVATGPRAWLGALLGEPRAMYTLVGVLAAAVYTNTLGHGFAYDDQFIVVDNTAIQSWRTLHHALVQPYWPVAYGAELGLWRPVTTTVLGLAYLAGGGAPVVFHVVNVAVHVVATLLVLALLLELMSAGAALAAALVFAIHPVHVEAVANVVGLSELISTAAVLAACLLHVRSGTATGWRSAMGVGALYAVGFGAKESAVTLPGLIFLVDAARGQIGVTDLSRYLAQRWRGYIVMASVAAALLWGRFAVLGSVADPLGPLGAQLLQEIPRIWTLGEIWMHYVRLWVFPLDLSVDYSPGVIPISIGWGVENTLGVGLALLFLGLALYAWRRRPMARGVDTSRAAAFGAVWFMLAISPVSNALFLSGVLLAERTLYLPSVGLAAATGWLVVRLARERPRIASIGLIVIVMLGGLRTWTRNPVWHDSARMLDALVADYPHAGRSQWVLGDQFLRVGDDESALRAYRAAISLLGVDYQLFTEISKRLIESGYYRGAEVLLGFAADEEPRYPLAHGLLAQIRAEHGDAPAAEAHSRTSLALEGDDATREHLLAWALAAQGQLREAAEARARAVALGESWLWQRYAYQAYVRAAAGDSVGLIIAVDSAWARAHTEFGRAALDSVIVAEFGLPSRRAPTASDARGSGRR